MKPKTVKAWAFAVEFQDRKPLIQTVNETRASAVGVRKFWMKQSKTCGPIVSVEVPLAKARLKR